MPKIAAEFGVTMKSTAASVTATLLVRLLGSFCAGWLADRVGRKWPLMISIVWFSVCDGLVSIAPTFRAVVALRILYGFGMGAEWTAGATLAMEAWPARSRGFASGVLQAGWAVGYLLASVVYAYVMPLYGWRALFVIAAAPALLVLPIRYFVPDTKAVEPPSERPLRSTPELTRQVMLASFVHTAGLTGTEVGVAAATAFVNQKLLGALFGEAAMVELISRARRRLDDALVETFDEERRRFENVAPVPEELEALAADLRDAGDDLRRLPAVVPIDALAMFEAGADRGPHDATEAAGEGVDTTTPTRR